MMRRRVDEGCQEKSVLCCYIPPVDVKMRTYLKANTLLIYFWTI